ncbi:MAG TPA: DUF4129 domain-containing protein [Thermoplasmata archaeon]|nr:DUF4129 domain-containing protein [Thermoplasmata archaeon]
MSPWWKRPEAAPPEILEQVEPVEVPLLTEVKRMLAEGDFRGAILHAYPIVSGDLSKAFGVPFPKGMTHEEFLRRASAKQKGLLPQYLHRLYELYAPVRYGSTEASESPATLTELLKSIYAQRAMWRLYIEPRHPPEEPPEGAPAVEPSPEPMDESTSEAPP